MHPLAWCLLWMLAHVASRVAVSPALELDEAEQALWSQTLAWGYGSQAPLEAAGARHIFDTVPDLDAWLRLRFPQAERYDAFSRSE